MNDTQLYGIKALRIGASVFGPAAGWVKYSGNLLSGSREEMVAKAEELNANCRSANVRYSVEEMDNE